MLRPFLTGPPGRNCSSVRKSRSTPARWTSGSFAEVEHSHAEFVAWEDAGCPDWGARFEEPASEGREENPGHLAAFIKGKRNGKQGEGGKGGWYGKGKGKGGKGKGAVFSAQPIVGDMGTFENNDHCKTAAKPQPRAWQVNQTQP